MPRPPIFHGKGLCNCDYGTPLDEALDCGCCGVAAGKPCVTSEMRRCPHDECPKEGCLNTGLPHPAAPSHTVVSPTKLEMTADEEFLRNFQAVNPCAMIKLADERFERMMAQKEALAPLPGQVKVCSAHIPCCWGRGLRTPYLTCKGTEKFSTRNCPCHEGRP